MATIMWAESGNTGLIYPRKDLEFWRDEPVRWRREAEERERQCLLEADRAWACSDIGLALGDVVRAVAGRGDPCECGKRLARLGYQQMDRRFDEWTGQHYFYEPEDCYE